MFKKTGVGCYSSCLDVLGSVSRAGNTARLTVCDSITDLDAVVARGPDFVLLVAKYIFIQSAENIWFSDYFYKMRSHFLALIEKRLDSTATKF
jgi:D-alanine-D-alanine ligase